ncbi:membrane protein [Streptomyces rimosus]|nr:membrane protein [Streptomyces rimosus]
MSEYGTGAGDGAEAPAQGDLTGAADHPAWSAPGPGPAEPAGPAPVTPADAADAARLVSFGLQPKLLPARDAEYGELPRRYRDEPAFARLADAVATGLGLVVLEVSPRVGMAVTADEDSVFAVRMGDYARRASADSADRFLHGLAHLAVAALAFPRPEDLADDGYIGRITVNGVDAFVRQACRRLEERAEEQGENTDPATDAPGLEAAWRTYARRSATGATKDARRLAGSTTGIIAKAVAFLVDSGFLQRTGDDAGGAYRTTARYQLQVRDMAGSAAMAELLELGVVPVSDGGATLLPAEDTDDLELVSDAGLPFHSS